MTSASLSYRGYRYPADIIAQAVRLYYRFPLSYRGVEELLFERGVVVSYETIRAWCLKWTGHRGRAQATPAAAER